MSAIAIVGMACRYPDAHSPRELWENVLAQRRSFRRIPAVRLRTEDYSAEGTEDGIYVRTAAVLEDYEFDRVRFQVSKETFESTDLVHWLALDVASQALQDAKLLQLSESQRERIGVYIGNSLTGEFSRASLLRLRWPYVRRVVAAALQKHAPGLNGDLHKLLDEIEDLYKSPFPATTEESLAGGLSNTIAGRICNYFNFKGGGYTVDGACASSLLAVANACSALEAGDVDVAIAGGVDLSLDPFELAGFSKLGALARGKMRVFDEHSSGFIPGEGCGMVVLMRDDHAAAQQLSPYALIRGWGISSDGSGGITRPEVSGQLLALRRAYQRAGYGIDSVSYFEGHGTGTTVGDATELQALSLARREAHADAPPAALGSIKANIGHTKAAAGVAGLMKAAIAVRTRVVPPTTGCDTPHPQLKAKRPALRIVREGELWPDDAPVRAGVSAMGFGGINTHLTLEAADTLRRRSFTGFEQQQLASAQDCELFLFQAADTRELASRLEEILACAGELSCAELGDLAAWLAQQNRNQAGEVRAACVAASAEELEAGLRKLLEWCAEGAERRIDVNQGLFLGLNDNPRIGFVFPGQGSPVYVNGGIWSQRFSAIQELYRSAGLPKDSSVATEVAQPCVVTASIAGLHALELCGIEGSIALGHSLGEVTALYWAGACERNDLLRLVKERGRIMAEMATPHGSMASVRAGYKQVKDKLNGDPLAIAAYNSPRQTVVSGKAEAVREFTARLHSAGIAATVLPVSHAFHSPLVADVATAFSDFLAGESFGGLCRRVASTVTGNVLESDTDLRELLRDQITMPVQFSSALEIAAAECDLLIEVGPGTVLSGIAAECTDKPIIPLNVGAESLRGLLLAVGAAFALGAPVRTSALFDGRFVRPIDPRRKHSFLKNPCETILETVPARPVTGPVSRAANGIKQALIENGQTAIEALRTLVAQRTELPIANIKAENRFLDDLHLNSITVSQIILQAAAQLGLSAPAIPGEYANVTIQEAAATLEGMRRQSPERPAKKFPHGVDSWMRVLAVEWIEQPRRPAPSISPGKWQIHGEPGFALRGELEREFRAIAGSGMVCCVPAERDQSTAAFLLECVQTALHDRAQQIVFLQDGSGASAFARTLYLEHPNLKVSVVNVPLDHPKAAYWAAQEAAAANGFTEAQYDQNGTRREPRLKLLWLGEESPAVALTSEDVLLVTGGGRGIAAECALELAREFKCRLALLGRSDPAKNSGLELEKNLARFAQAGISFRYFVADVSDTESLSQTIGKIQAELGCVTAVLHGAGTNVPKRVEEISAADLQATLAPKVTGLSNLLKKLDAGKLRLLITFGSIIGRTGLHGEAHYGLANEWLTTVVERWQADHPSCRCVNLEWSVWAGAGMGQRLGVLESLMRQGLTPLPLDDAIGALKKMIAWQHAPVSSIITGRFGNLRTLRFPDSELPLRRFLEHIQIYYPGIELIADAELNAETDPYVMEHVFQGEQLLPAVCGIEAMAQAAMALEGIDQLPEFHQLRFEHPIVVPAGKSITIRIAALRRCPGEVSIAIRCSSTSFQVDHFKGECIFQTTQQAAVGLSVPSKVLPLDPARDLYGGILFHQGRFCRVEKYCLLEASKSIAGLRAPAASSWYARHLPPELVAGDPASRDAALHSIQACIPHKTILPVGIDRVIPGAGWTRDRCTVHATERLRDGNDFIYDVTIANEHGEICERWQGLHLHAVGPGRMPHPLAWPLLGPYLERMLGEVIPSAQLRVMLAKDGDLANAIREMFGPHATLAHRPDGKPEILGVSDPIHISLSHSAGLTLIVAAKQEIGCDLEKVKARENGQWKQLLGENFPLAPLIAERTNISLDAAATEVWSLNESLRKAGAGLEQSLRLQKVLSERWVVLNSGAITAASFHTRLDEGNSEVAFAVVINNSMASLEARTAPQITLNQQTNTEAGMQ